MRIRSQPNAASQYVYTPSQVFRKLEEPETIGALLVASGALQPGQVNGILAEQARSGETFGAAAVRLGVVSRDEVERVLAKQFGMPTVASATSKLHVSLVLAHGKRDTQSEQIRSARAKLALANAAHSDPAALSFVICSAERQAGRSYTAANLAIAFAQAGARTLLIDADLRQPCQHLLFGLDNRIGLSGFLAGRHQQSVVHQIDDITGLGVISAGPLPPNPRELLSKPAMLELCSGASWAADVIILDCPALEDADDGVQLSAMAGAAVAVIRRNRTSQQQAAQISDQITSAPAQIIGLILNSRAT